MTPKEYLKQTDTMKKHINSLEVDLEEMRALSCSVSAVRYDEERINNGTRNTEAPFIVLKKNRQTRDVLFIDASREFVKGKNQNKLSEENIQKILETYAERKDVEKYAHLATFEEIKENDYNLNIPRYVDTFEEEEPIDMVHVGNDIKKIRQEQQVLEKELLEAISSLQTTPENEAWLQGALEVFKHEQ